VYFEESSSSTHQLEGATMLRRIRGALSLAGLWAVAWVPVGVLVGLAKGWSHLPPRSKSELVFLAVWTFLGASSGAVFAALLATLEKNRTLADLSPRRLAVWGAIGGAALPVVVSLLITTLVRGLSLNSDAPGVFLIMALMGSVCAWLTLRIARTSGSRSELGVPSA
jgi:hypothetical protein